MVVKIRVCLSVTWERKHASSRKRWASRNVKKSGSTITQVVPIKALTTWWDDIQNKITHIPQTQCVRGLSTSGAQQSPASSPSLTHLFLSRRVWLPWGTTWSTWVSFYVSLREAVNTRSPIRWRSYRSQTSLSTGRGTVTSSTGWVDCRRRGSLSEHVWLFSGVQEYFSEWSTVLSPLVSFLMSLFYEILSYFLVGGRRYILPLPINCVEYLECQYDVTYIET